MFENKKILQLVSSAVMALLFVQFYLKAKEQNIELGFGIVNVVCAARDIAPNKLITPDLLTTKSVARRFMEPGALQEKIPGETAKRIIGKVTMAAVPTGGTITQHNLRHPSALATGVAPTLPPKTRGYVLRLGNLDVAKLILGGDHIDILATFTVRQKGSESTSKMTYTILQNILVVAVDKEIIDIGTSVTGKKETTEGRLLTLALTPLQSNKLAHAQIESGGEISVVVRAQGDDSIEDVPAVSASNLLEHSPQAAPSPLPPRTPAR